MSELSAAEEKIKKAIAGQVSKDVEELHNGYLLELEGTREKMREDYEAFTEAQARVNEEVATRLGEVAKKVEKLETEGPAQGPLLLDGFIPDKTKARFKESQRKAAGGLSATQNGREAQRIAYAAADTLVDCMELKSKPKKVYHLDALELAAIAVGGAVLGAAGITATALSISKRQLKRHGKTTAELNAWIETPVVKVPEQASNVVQLEPARAAMTKQ